MAMKPDRPKGKILALDGIDGEGIRFDVRLAFGEEVGKGRQIV